MQAKYDKVSLAPGAFPLDFHPHTHPHVPGLKEAESCPLYPQLIDLLTRSHKNIDTHTSASFSNAHFALLCSRTFSNFP